MVLKHLDDTQGQDPRGDEQHIPPPLTGEASSDGFTSYQVLGLATDQTSTPTGMRDEILLVAWLLVLLRTREDGQVRHDWAYRSREAGEEEHDQVNNTLSTDQVMPNLQTKVQEVAEAVSRHVANVVPSYPTTSTSPASLLLSTGSLSEVREGGRDEVSEMVHVSILLTA